MKNVAIEKYGGSFIDDGPLENDGALLDDGEDDFVPENKRKKMKKNDVIPTKPVCSFGKSCYRKNPQHFQEFDHPWLRKADSDVLLFGTNDGDD